MNKILENIKAGFGALVITGAIVGLTYLIVPKKGENLDKSINSSIRKYVPKTRTEKLNSVSWYIFERDDKGNEDVIVTPHRNSYYGTKGPIYVEGQGDLEGKKIFDAAKELIGYKNDFSKLAGSNQKFPWLCRVDDFDEDGVADKISWPRMGDKMPIYEKPFFKDLQQKADSIVSLENQVLDYVLKKK